MHASSARQRGSHDVSNATDYDPAEHTVDRLTGAAGATSALCVLFLMVLAVL